MRKWIRKCLSFVSVETFVIESVDNPFLPPKKKVDYIFQLPAHVWEIASESMGVFSALELQSASCQACLVAAAAIREKILEPARNLPWSLVHDPEGEVERVRTLLRSGTLGKPRNETERKIFKLVGLGESVALFKSAGAALADVRWSSMATEQAHATAQLFARSHRFYSREMLRLRTFSRHLQILSPGDAFHAKEVRYSNQLERLRRKHVNVNKISGRQMFLKLSHLEGKTFEFEGDFSAEASRGLMTQHAYYYARLEDPY